MVMRLGGMNREGKEEHCALQYFWKQLSVRTLKLRQSWEADEAL